MFFFSSFVVETIRGVEMERLADIELLLETVDGLTSFNFVESSLLFLFVRKILLFLIKRVFLAPDVMSTTVTGVTRMSCKSHMFCCCHNMYRNAHSIDNIVAGQTNTDGAAIKQILLQVHNCTVG
jgi:hypothetical protein